MIYNYDEEARHDGEGRVQGAQELHQDLVGDWEYPSYLATASVSPIFTSRSAVDCPLLP